MPNRLANETSPYLLQHKDNPVDWHPWGQEALERARTEDRPILLSIGYAACHWCHVMEHESFENPEIAALMNEHFVSIKVDREERPDLDAVYMDAVQSLTGHGGWPMTVFLTPEGNPFYGGTYYPPEDRQGMPGFPRVLRALADAYRDNRDELETSAREIGERLRGASSMRLPTGGEIGERVLDGALAALEASYDPAHGGFGGAPKFPQPAALEFALRSWRRTGNTNALELVTRTLDAMAAGGLYDHLGGGFHRYSVDARWLVPHFEKMLYDNAQLAPLYLHAWQSTGEPRYRRVAEETLDYALRDMTAPEGGFYSTEDADTEGEEGRYYVWTPPELREALGEEDAGLVGLVYDVTERGNFEGRSILNLPRPLVEVARLAGKTPDELEATLARCRARLLEARARRVRPDRDEKVLTSWNGLMLRALAEAASALDRAEYREAAIRNAEFVLSSLRADGRLRHSYKDGEARVEGYLEDYAFYADGLLALWEATFDPRWLREARALADTILDRFWDPELPGFYETGPDHERLFNRPRSLYDNAVPAGQSVATDALLRLGSLYGEERYADAANRVLTSLAPTMAEHPLSFGRLLWAADLHVDTPLELAIVGDPADGATAALAAEAHHRYLPTRVLAAAAPGGEPSRELLLLENRPQQDGRPTAYLCHDYVCQPPVTSPARLGAQIDAATTPAGVTS